MKKSVLFIILLLMSGPLFAQSISKWGIRTNSLSDIMLAPDLRVDLYSGANLSFSAGGAYGWWGFDWDRKNALQQWHIGVDARYYLKKDYTFTGHHLGLGAQTGQFDFKRKEKAKRGQFATAGLLYGYTWRLSDYFYLDAGLGLGYIYTFYHKYEYSSEKDCYCCTGHPTKHLLGLTNLNVSIIYRFKGGKK